MSDFDWGIWAKKGFKKVVAAALIGGGAELVAYLNMNPVPTQYVWITALVVVVLEMILNAVKHSN